MMAQARSMGYRCQTHKLKPGEEPKLVVREAPTQTKTFVGTSKIRRALEKLQKGRRRSRSPKKASPGPESVLREAVRRSLGADY